MADILPYGIHWFRRDLRIAGNPALAWNARKFPGPPGSRVLGLFCLDGQFLARGDFSKNRFGFFLETLEALRQSLREAGSELLVIEGSPRDAFPALLSKLGAAPAVVSWNRDYEPFAVSRDEAVRARLLSAGVAVHDERDHLLIEPGDLPKLYRVFTPFYRRWLEALATPEVQGRVKAAAAKAPRFALTWSEVLGKNEKTDVLDEYRRRNEVTVPLPPAGAAAALARVAAFEKQLSSYPTARDLPAKAGTSQFSVYLKNGSLTVAQVIASYRLTDGTFLKELAWREFFYHILARHPYVERSAFQNRYANIVWENREEHFRAWCEGRTGFPIVDAAMRQLLETGWMHNRARMIVASFLVKDLLIDWRWGERWFMEQLLDGDLAPNNGGWQWAASTGCDAQPYFRVFNPELQQRKFDPSGAYVARWVPELGKVGYPRPIVDHATQRAKAIALFRDAPLPRLPRGREVPT